MKRRLLCASLLIAMFGLSSIAQSNRPRTKAEQEVYEVDQLWAKSRVAVDKATMNRILADDLIYSHFAGGEPDNKKYFVSTMVLGQEYIKLEPYSIRVYGDAAVLMGRLQVKGLNSDRITRNFYTRVYVKKNNQWQMVTSQAGAAIKPEEWTAK